MTMDLFNEIAHRFGHVKSVSPGLFANGQIVLRVQFSYVDDFRDFVKVSEIKILLSPSLPATDGLANMLTNIPGNVLRPRLLLFGRRRLENRERFFPA